MEIFYITDILMEIMCKLDPVHVINLYQVSKQFMQIYADSDIFGKLITLNYPRCKITNDPKNQYISIISGVSTKYYSPVNVSLDNVITDTNGNSIKIIDLFLNEVYLHDDDSKSSSICNFTVIGSRPNDGDIYWLMMTSIYIDIGGEIFISKSDAIHAFLDANYDDIVINIIVDYLDDIEPEGYEDINENLYNEGYRVNIKTAEKVFNMKSFKSYLMDRHYPYDIHRQSLFEYIMTNSFYNSLPDTTDPSYSVIYQFVEVAIRNISKK